MSSSVENGELSVNGGNLSAGKNAENFYFVKAYNNAKACVEKYKLNSASSKDEFVSRLNSAIADHNSAE